jgi:membrane fusion protein (multidrug efflux system)
MAWPPICKWQRAEDIMSNQAAISLRTIDLPLATETAADKPATKARTTPRKKAPFIFGALALAAAGLGAHMYISSLGKETTDDAQIEGHVSQVAARVPGQVKRVLVHDNQKVKVGDVLIELDDADYDARLAAARADLEASQASLHAAETQRDLTRKQVQANLDVARGGIAQAAAVSGSTEALIDQARADVTAAESRAQLAHTELGRAQRLFDAAAIPQQELDSKRSVADTADAALAQSRARVITAEANRSNSSGTALAAHGHLLSAQTAPEQIDAAEAQVQLARARVAQTQSAVHQAELNSGYTKIRAEIDGEVAKRTVEPGQMVDPARPLLAIVGTTDTWVVANLKETQLEHVHAGEKVRVAIDTFDGATLDGVVESIQAGTGARFSLLPPDNASGNFTKVTQRVPVRIEIADRRGLELRPGMSADVTIITAE